MNLIRTITVILLAVHGFLAIWALIGFAEWFSTTPPWNRVSNPLFPREVLFIQWALTLTAASAFILGYVFRCQYTPLAMACVYAAMAALCAVETIRYMESDSRFIAMGVEYLAYAGILVFLFRARIFQPV
jgi:hypothetical protein